jgi:hypothetical protein
MRVRATNWWPHLGHASPARTSPLGVLRATAVAVILVTAGVTAGSSPAVGEQAVSLRLAYSCSFSTGSRPVSARITGTFPAIAVTGQPVRPTGTAITVTVPHAAVTALARRHAATITLTAALVTRITDGARAATAIWRDFRSPATAVPATGPLTITGSGTAAPVTAPAPGEVTVAAAALSLTLTGHTAAGRPASLRAACAPGPGQDTILARIAVHGSAPPAARVSASGNPKKCLPFISGMKLNPIFPLPRPLPGAHRSYFPEKACANSTGFTDARRLDEAALVGPGLADLVLGIPAFFKSIPPSYGYVYQKATGRFEYQGLPELPPARATLLAFGFMPVSATIEISEIGQVNVALVSCGTGTKLCPHRPLLNRALFYGLVSLRISDVSVNGMPLNVGPHCQTATPFDLELTGVPPAYNISRIHGVLTGTATIPPFSGCANGPDNLDTIFNATVSGPGNFVQVTQAVPCFSSPPGPVCPPRKPIPVH